MKAASSDPVAPGLGRDQLVRLLDAVDAGGREPRGVETRWSGAHSNDVYELRFPDGRRLMLKCGRYEWAEGRFRTSGAAAELLREKGVVVPEPLPLPDDLDSRPLQAYWRIPLVTLEALWPDLTPAARASAMRSWGELLTRVHDVQVEGWGELRPSTPSQPRLEFFLERDIGERLLPACHAIWSDAADSLERLLTLIGAIVGDAINEPANLAHNDLHMGNILCRVVAEDEVQCVGLLDLEAAAAAPPESDVGSLEALHGPLFDQHVSPRLRARVWESYGRSVDPRAVAFYRALHLANLGFHSALIEDRWHADRVAEALRSEVVRLERGVGAA